MRPPLLDEVDDVINEEVWQDDYFPLDFGSDHSDRNSLSPTLEEDLNAKLDELESAEDSDEVQSGLLSSEEDNSLAKHTLSYMEGGYEDYANPDASTDD